jgi:ABC-type branched-subunit amino acid transport system substrate-binding protein
MVLGVLMLAVGTGAIAASSTPQTIPVGAVASLTGFFSNLGNQVKAGYEIGVEDVNRAGAYSLKSMKKNCPST